MKIFTDAKTLLQQSLHIAWQHVVVHHHVLSDAQAITKMTWKTVPVWKAVPKVRDARTNHYLRDKFLGSSKLELCYLLDREARPSLFKVVHVLNTIAVLSQPQRRRPLQPLPLQQLRQLPPPQLQKPQQLPLLQRRPRLQLQKILLVWFQKKMKITFNANKNLKTNMLRSISKSSSGTHGPRSVGNRTKLSGRVRGPNRARTRQTFPEPF